MKMVKVLKADLLAVLKKNFAEHQEIFEEAVEGYRKEMITHLENLIREIRSGKRVSHHISLSQPMNQSKEYERAIRMCEMSVDDTIELDETSFACLVMDDWAWMNQFLCANSQYSTKAVMKSSTRGDA